MKTELKLTDIYPFGKWKGVPIVRMLPIYDHEFFINVKVPDDSDGLGYLCWVRRECKNIKLSQGITNRMKIIYNHRNHQRPINLRKKVSKDDDSKMFKWFHTQL